MSFRDSNNESSVRAFAEAARLAGFEDVSFLPKATGVVHHILYDLPCYLQPKPGPLRFIVVEASGSAYRTGVVAVNGRITSLEVWECSRRNFTSPSCFNSLRRTLQCLDSCKRCQVVGILVTVPSSYDASRRSVMISGVLDILQRTFTQLEVQDVNFPGAACRGIVYGSSQGNTEHVIVGRPFYPIAMAVSECYGNMVQLFGSSDVLPCHKKMTLIRPHPDEHGLVLRFQAGHPGEPSMEWPLIEVAIESLEVYWPHTLSMEAFMTSNHTLWFHVRVDDGQSLASIQYSAAGILSIDSDYMVVIDEYTRKAWLPRDAIQESGTPKAVGEKAA